MCYYEIKPCVKDVLTVLRSIVNTIGMAYVIIKIENFVSFSCNYCMSYPILKFGEVDIRKTT